MDWYGEVADYKKQYDNEEGIHEWVDGLLPIYYSDILSVFTSSLCGCGLEYLITKEHVDMSIGDIMVHIIYNEYYEQFVEAYYTFEEEE